MTAPELEIDFSIDREPARLLEELDDEAFGTLRALRAIGPATKGDLADKSGIEKRKVKYRLNKKLEPVGLVEQVGSSKVGDGASYDAHVWGLTDLGKRWTEQFREDLLSGEFRAAPGPMLASLLDDVEELRQLSENNQSAVGTAFNDMAELREQLDEVHTQVDQLRIEVEGARHRTHNPDGVDLPEHEFDELGDRIDAQELLAGQLYLTLHDEVEDVRDAVEEARSAAAESVENRVEILSENIDMIREDLSKLKPRVKRLDESIEAARKFAPPDRRQVEWDSLRQRLAEMHRVLEQVSFDYDAGDRV